MSQDPNRRVDAVAEMEAALDAVHDGFMDYLLSGEGEDDGE